MGDVISLRKGSIEGEGEEITATGKARCMVCGHEWLANAPAGTVYLECPGCRSMKGVFIGACSREGVDIWGCGCGNQLFELTKIGAFCPNCGVWVTGWCG
jgi:Zn finger protein HypA/HybF involved in hydrogenase expression